MSPTEQQVRFFDTFGFICFPGLFADATGRITESFEQVWADHGGGHHGQAHDHRRRSGLLQFIDRNEYLCGLLDDPRIDQFASAVLGGDYNYKSSDGNLHASDTAWHSDADIPKPTIKAAFYLDEVTADSGCLRVIPGSHKSGDGYATALNDMVPSIDEQHLEERLGVDGSQVPAVALESRPGDLVCFDRRIKHAAFGGGTRRRMFTIILEPRHTDEELDSLRENIAVLARYWLERAYGKLMIETAGPERMVHLEQRMANDGHLKVLARRAREKMEEPER